jgi:hypothetical protein
MFRRVKGVNNASLELAASEAVDAGDSEFIGAQPSKFIELRFYAGRAVPPMLWRRQQRMLQLQTRRALP